MKIIVETATGLSKYLLADKVAVIINADHIIVGEPAQLIVADLNAGNSAVHEGVKAPADWIGDKYTFDGTEWAANPDWIDPNAEPIPA